MDRHCFCSTESLVPDVPRTTCLFLLEDKADSPITHQNGHGTGELLGARTLLGAKGIVTRSKDATSGSWLLAILLGARTLLGAKGIHWCSL